jgi:TonB family protein
MRRLALFAAAVLGLWLSGTSISAQQTGRIGTPQENSAKPTRIRVGANIPTATTQNTPEYPQTAVDQGINGKVVLHLIIGGDGTVKEVSTQSGPAVLADSAMEVVKGWRYQPVKLNGSPVEVDTTVTLNYVLDPSPTVTIDTSPRSKSSSQQDIPCISRRLPSPAADGNVAASASMRGQIRDGTYENSYFGLTYTPDAMVIFNASKFFANNPATVNSFGLFSAWAEEQVGKATMGAVAFADRLSNYPEGCRDTENILTRYIQNQRGDGYQVVNEKKQRQLGNITFLEADFRRGQVSEAVLLASRKGYVLVFVFNASNPTDLDNFISSSRIALADKTED